MDWHTMLLRSGGISALARMLGTAPATVSAGTQALLPALLQGLRHEIAARGGGAAGMNALLAFLSSQGGGQLAVDMMAGSAPSAEAGEAIVERLLGPEVATRAVLAEAERTAGIDVSLGKQLLHGLAILLGGYVSARASSGQADEQALADLARLFDDGPQDDLTERV